MYVETISSVKKWLQCEMSKGSHDYFHSIRVFNNVIYIVKHETIPEKISFISEISALLHDVGHKKDSYLEKNAHEKDANGKVIELLRELKIEESIIKRVLFCINNHRYSQGDSVGRDVLELQILRDADRLDALGAIAIARTFSYDSNRPIYIPEDLPKNVYDGISTSSMNHISEKILQLTPDKFYLNASKKMAEGRLEFVRGFVDEFFKEWDGLR